ncbi:MAG: DUF86 domain-containing protein [Duncaniella sp.]|nr:DUF86 domain-containing protein [Duncaniella sp.]MDE6812782.1 DUF86 domain-containing protein [Duncaniella sp.]MDE7476270.1 DUF86 domain-containing protein [Duncaniella sp.]
MRDRLTDKTRLEHILSAIDVILDNRDKYDFERVLSDPIVFFGFVKHIEIIGEAVYKLTKEFRSKHPEVEWDVIEGMRHVLVHGYYTIRPEQLWSTIIYDIPELYPLIKGLYDDF